MNFRCRSFFSHLAGINQINLTGQNFKPDIL